jgi:pilus assembly protein CpaC
MHPMKRFGRRTLAALTMIAGLGGPLAAQPTGNQAGMTGVQVKIDPRTKALIVPLGGTVKFEPDLGSGVLPRDFSVQNEQMVNVRLDPTTPKQLILRGDSPGLTRVTVLTSDNRRVAFDVVVEVDYEQLRNIIKRTLPTASVEIVPGVGQSVILTGFVNKPEDASLVEQIARASLASQAGPAAPGMGGGAAPAAGAGGQVINAIQIGGNQHVQIDMVVASVNRSETRERQFDFLVNGTTASGGSILNQLILPVPGGGGQPPLISPQANLQLGIVPANFFGALRALRTEGLAKFLTEPKLVTQSGRAASILAGGRQAILSGQSGITGPGVQLEPVGTEVDVLPIVMGNGKIYLEVFPRVRTVNAARGITVGGALSVGFDEQSARATVMLESGQTFAIGGLIESSVTASASKVPVLGDMPFIGTAFSGINHREIETELVILVTPRLVEPLDCNQVPRRLPGRETRSPDDYELFLENLIEAPRGQRKVWSGKKYNAAHKCDPNGAFPCAGNVCGENGSNCGQAGCTNCGGQAAAPASAVPMTPMTTTPAVLPPVGQTTAAPAPAVDITPVSVQPVMVPATPGETPVAPPVPMTLPQPLPQEAPVALPEIK